MKKGILKRAANLKTRNGNMAQKWYDSATDGVSLKVLKSCQKKKTAYAEQYPDGNITVNYIADRSKRKALSDIGNKADQNFTRSKRSAKAQSRNIEKRSLNRGRKSYENEPTNEKASTYLGTKVKKAKHASNGVVNGGRGDVILKKGAKSNANSGNDMNDEKSRDTLGSSEKFLKRRVQSKKVLADKSDIIEARPTKSKRVIRIDSHDITNKRLDDGTFDDDKSKEEDNSEKSGNSEISKNAQFRAIQPSPSILSFVEENLLGRRREIELRRAGYNVDISAPLDNIPSSTSLEREKIDEPIFRNKLSFFAAAKVSSSLPPSELPEIAFAGRSNVGKSSLLNSLTRQWGVVRTSDKPGLTQTINFFRLGSKVCLVDLPGYGFAYAKEEVKEAWEDLVKEYVSTRVGLQKVCLLIDTKWGLKPRDHELIDLMERYQTKYQIVMTKTDLVFPIDVARRAMQIEESLKANKSVVQPVMMVSSKSGAGIRCLRTVLAKIARFAKA